MKKNFIYALWGAIALIGATGLVSCSDETVLAEDNPGYDPVTGEVPVQFVLNISSDSKPATRMAATTVQEGTSAFRGIQNAKLLTYKATSDGSHITSADATGVDRLYDLDILIGRDGLKATGKPESKRVLELSLPTGTNTLMFWGRALRGTVDTGKDPFAVLGGIDFSPSSTLSEASFKLKPCVPDDETTTGSKALVQYQNLIETVLNQIINAGATVSATSLTDATKTVNKTMYWKDYVTFNNDGTLTAKTEDPSTGASMSGLGEILANEFVAFNTFQQSELRNAEGHITAALIADICKVMYSVQHAEGTTLEELCAKQVAGFVYSAISKFFDVSGMDGASYSCTWMTISNVVNSSGLSTDNTNKIDNTKNLKDFPSGIFHLPPGSTVLKYEAVREKPESSGEYETVNEYHFMTNIPTYAMGSVGGSFNPFNYMYPAELCYFGNSPVRVTSDTHVAADYPDGVTNWDDDDQWKAGASNRNNTVDWTKDSHVVSSTRSVAMQENINYGTSMLVSTIKYAAGLDKLYDNNKHFHPDENNKEITDFSDKFELTGILIGGQAQEVGWNYIPKAATGETYPKFECMVYDDQLPSTTIPTPSGSENYTMVWDNWNQQVYDADNTSGKQNTVYVALQFKNKAGDFWGMNNVIRNNSTFYIIGELDPDIKPTGFSGESGSATQTDYESHKSWGISWPEKYALPPYDSGQTIMQRRVFIQDHKTIANFVIGAYSLQYALVSVPDLRAAQISLGLSVDLTWQSGLTFDDVVIGGNKDTSATPTPSPDPEP